uniref:Uncharacterized protein n=1 Tax=Arundo donax TaxID=35708 RepID=A0A0A9DEP0_ARUDO
MKTPMRSASFIVNAACSFIHNFSASIGILQKFKHLLFDGTAHSQSFNMYWSSSTHSMCTTNNLFLHTDRSKKDTPTIIHIRNKDNVAVVRSILIKRVNCQQPIGIENIEYEINARQQDKFIVHVSLRTKSIYRIEHHDW